MVHKLKKTKKHSIIITLIILTAIISIAVPTFSRFNNGINSSMDLLYWDGSIASSYSMGSGTKDDPYLISSGAEFAYFSESLKSNDYAGIYFRLDNDIILNPGYFSYSEESTSYIYEDNELFLKKYTNELYNTSDISGDIAGTVNTFDYLGNFAGHLDGAFYAIYGLYITSETEENLALFNNISGSISNLFIENMLIVGGNNSSGLAINASDFNIKDTYLSGYVITDIDGAEQSETKEYENKNISTELEAKELTLIKETDSNEEIISSTISGNYLISDETDAPELKINDEVVEIGSFEIDLGTKKLDEVKVSIAADTVIRNISFTALKYEVVYKKNISTGIANYAKNTDVSNVITNLNIKNTSSAAGFIGTASENINITNSYNEGNISGNYSSSGIINSVNNASLVINKVYNKGTILGTNTAGIVDEINNSNSITINNSINTSSNLFVGEVKFSDTILSNNYNYFEDSENNILSINSFNIYSSEFLTNLGYNEFIEDANNNENVWIHSNLNLPELYFVNELNLVDIRIGSDAWNNSTLNPNNIYYNRDVTIAITSSAPVYTLEKVEYYVKYDEIALTGEEILNLEWLNYEGAVTFSEEGKYILYAKLTDYSGNVRYVNSDIINIDKTDPTATIIFDSNSWSTYRSDVADLLILDQKSVSINATDNETGIKEIDYYVTSKEVSKESLESLNDANWQSYQNELNIEPIGNNILYARITDNSGNISYLNSDFLTFGGYNMSSIGAGRTNLYRTNDDIYITEDSSVNLNYVYNLPHYDEPEINHFVSYNQTLPFGTIITLKDNIKGKVYEYEISTDSVGLLGIDFENFFEVGNTSNKFIEDDYSDGINISEDFTLILNFEKADISSNIGNLKIWVEVKNNAGDVVRGPLESTINSINVIKNQDISVDLSSETSGIIIKHNSDSISNINIKSSIIYGQSGSYNVINTQISDQDIILKMNILDDKDNLVDRDNLSNFAFKLNGKTYYPDSNGTITINNESGLLGINEMIELYAYKGDNFLPVGDYKLEVISSISYNDYLGKYQSTINIPLSISKSADINNIDFKVNNTSDIILNQENETDNINLNIVFNGAIDPSMRISLYKKDEYNAVSQNYSLVDINAHITSTLTAVSPNIYEFTNKNLNLIFNTNTLDKQSYKIVIEVFDGDELVGTKEEYFIVK